jgi:hypothetical protein
MKPVTALNFKPTATVPSVCPDRTVTIYHDAETCQAPIVNESSSLLPTGNDAKTSVERRGVILKAALYAVQVFYSFFIM